jgi:hypothetical protein
MPAAAVVTLVIAALLVAALAFYLTWVVLLLRRIDSTLGAVLEDLRAVADRTAPVNDVVADINADLRVVAEGLEELTRQTAPHRPAGQA